MKNESSLTFVSSLEKKVFWNGKDGLQRNLISHFKPRAAPLSVASACWLYGPRAEMLDLQVSPLLLKAMCGPWWQQGPFHLLLPPFPIHLPPETRSPLLIEGAVSIAVSDCSAGANGKFPSEPME